MMTGVKHMPVVVSALLCAAAVALSSWAGTATLTAVVCAVCLVVALGWPQLMGVSARRSLSAVILAAGVVAAVGAGIVGSRENLFFWSSVALAFGVMTVFVIQVLRGAEVPASGSPEPRSASGETASGGRSDRLESTLGACAGVVITTTAAGWVAGLRYPYELSTAGGADMLSAMSSWNRLHYEQWGVLSATGPGGELSVVALAAVALIAATLIACLPGRSRLVVPATVLAGCAGSLAMALLWGELTLLFAAVLGLCAGALVGAFRRFLALHGPPEGLAAACAVGAAPVAVMGALVYFTERLLFV